MIDWVTCTLKCKHDYEKLQSGRVFSMTKDGEIEWLVEKAMNVEGSFSSNIQLRSVSTGHIWISGNPAKFLQGHNVFGTDDLKYLMAKFFDALLKIDLLSLDPTDQEYQDIQDGHISLLRVDINQSWLLESKSDVLAWIRAAGKCAALRRRGKGQFSGDTLYFQKNSRHWAVKCYSKGHELSAKGRGLHPRLAHPQLIDWAEKALRIELVLRSMFLRKTPLQHVSHWTPETARMLLHSVVLDNLEISDNMAINDEILAALPTRLKGIYALWVNGDDMRAHMSKTAFYRWRKALLPYGVDIAMVQEDASKTNVVPLIRYLEAMPATIPAWAYELGLVA